MKICYLANAASSHTIKWCNYFKDKGYEIVVISLNPGKIKGVKVYNFNESNIRTRSNISKISYINKIGSIKKIVRKEKPDILHAHYASSYGLLGSLINYYPYVLSVWGSDIYIFPKKNILCKSIIKYNLKKADHIFSTSYNMAKETQLYTKKDIKITPFGVDTSLFRPDGMYSRKDNEKIIIGTVKTLSKVYGIDFLIKAFSLVKKKYPDKDIELHIAGKGEQEEYLKNLCKDLDIIEDVKFLGYLDNQENVVRTFNTFDIAVFPSLSESFGVAALEAQSCGIPVIVTDVGGFPEVVKDKTTGLIINKGDLNQLYSAIKYLIDNEDIRMQMGESGRQFVVNKYDINSNFEYVDMLYKDIVSV